MSIGPFLDKINVYILNPLILLMFGVATVVFLWGIVQFIAGASTDGGLEEAKKKILWGLVGMFVMFSAYGLVRLVLGTFNLRNSASQHETYIPL